MNGVKRMTAAVSVATVWTKPESPRPMDEPALLNPVQLTEWLKRMTVDDKLNLYEENRVQTQILYGTSVIAAEEREDWVKVLIPQQGTRKEAAGYPGWVPRRQLIEAAEKSPGSKRTEAINDPSAAKRVEVVSDKAWLYSNPSEPLIELSFLTSLPVLEEAHDWVKVQTPDGAAFVHTGDVRIIDSQGALASMPAEGYIGGESHELRLTDAPLAPMPAVRHMGRGIVEQGTRFLGLPYLWGGLSSYGYDCSGFAYSMHRYFGISIPRDASDQAKQGALIEKENLQPGDLLFFAADEGKGSVHHVGIYAGDNRMIHSPESKSCVDIVDLASYKLANEHCVSRRYWG